MTLQAKYNKLENDCFNLLTVDPNLLHDLKHFSLILRLENTVVGLAYVTPSLANLGGKFKIRIDGGAMVESTIVKPPFYDPDGARQKSAAAPEAKVAA